MSVLSEFKAFAVKGNVVDMAVGIIIGAAFGKIVSSFVGDAPAVVLAYGKFIQTVIDFIIVAFAIFMGVKAINRLRHQEEKKPAAPAVPTKEELLLGEIRDLLKEQNGKAPVVTPTTTPPSLQP